ncbi:carbonic anhydrase family protein [Emticicia sp. SJ17W-69]|uniref:carbonic anhydrase family protein n=1 Tax=Emticicia sp. SJ17W-69 TaxID=3421657 RepID=UPI003EB76CBE
MIQKLLTVSTIMVSLTHFWACDSSTKKSKAEVVNQSSSVKKNSHVMTKVEQDLLTPADVLQDFKDGNNRFKNGNTTQREHSEEIRKAATGGQFPKAMVLSCLDSRVPVEDVFDQGIGDVFVGRVAGNFVNTDLLGSMEFACKVAGAKLILIMGHQHCGAVKGAIDDVHLGNITSMLSNIKPAVEMSKNFEGEKSSKNEAFVKLVAQNNVRNTISQVRAKSEILRTMEKNGEIKIVGAFYTLRTGELQFIE